jgi:prepilin-type N-terminal cleavage/methylation domain-containing protein
LPGRGQAMRVKSLKGFTLVEALVTIFIIAVISTMAVSSFSKYRKRTNLRNAARVIAEDYASLKQRAVSECVHYKMILDKENNSYKVVKGSLNGDLSGYDTESAIIKRLNSFDGGIIFSINSPPKYSHSQIIFEPRGTVSAGSLFLENSDGFKATITSNLTGRVYLSFE